jgi:hypothetical protein
MGVEVQVTEMWDDWNITSDVHRRTLDHPEIYSFVDVSQNNHNKGQTHWDRFQWVREYIKARPRPINTVKTYGADAGTYGSTSDGVERWWRHLIGGAAGVRFHRPPAGLGLSEPAKSAIRAARLMETHVKLWRTEPANGMLRDRTDDAAYATARRGEACAVYFPREGHVGLDLSGWSGTYRLRWIDIASAKVGATTTVNGGSVIPLRTPRAGMWVATITR